MIEVILVYAGHSDMDALRFGRTYKEHPGDFPHRLVVMDDTPAICRHLPSAEYIFHDCAGLDNGKHQWAAANIEADLMVFMGGHCYFHRPGWLARFVEVFEQDREALLGAFATSLTRPHLRTTCYACDPALLTWLYPEPIIGRGPGGDRYDFEHGERSLTTRWLESGRLVSLVTWGATIGPDQWLDFRAFQWLPEEQRNLILRDKWTDAYRDFARCPSFNGEHRCEMVVEHDGKHWAGGRFFVD